MLIPTKNGLCRSDKDQFLSRSILLRNATMAAIIYILMLSESRSRSLPSNEWPKRKMLPTVLIIGARKCGTRALIDMLSLHPHIKAAQYEVHFFDRDENYAKGLQWYLFKMPKVSHEQIVEKSPSYFVTPGVPERVYAMSSSIKLLLIVRDPVTRVISDYTQIYYGSNSTLLASKTQGHVVNLSQSPPTFSSLAFHPDGSVNTNYKAIQISIYSQYLQPWLDVFPLSQIHVVDGDTLIRDPFPQLQKVENFLNLDQKLKSEDIYFNSTKGFHCWKKHKWVGDLDHITFHCLNDSKGRKHPNVDERLVKKLKEFYKPFNQRFYDMIGIDLGWPES